ncbi:MAG: ABC transporter ATP-binding protein [Synergistaceae bacterium]|nr:ABC transporter ATP-binding protein [Synergistaceae bacterium]
MYTLLEFVNLTKEYQRGNITFKAVNNVNLQISSHDFINIIGRSGSGKSTLLNLAAGMLSPLSGSIFLDGQDLTHKPDSALSLIRNNTIGFIPQGASALPNLTVMENILLPFYLYPHGGDGEGHAYILMEFLGIQHLADSYPAELSGGELRRAIIARAMINYPKIIIADEPTSDLDINSAHEVMQIFSRINSEGTAILLVSHDLDNLRFGKRVFTMSDGVLSEGNNLSV